MFFLFTAMLLGKIIVDAMCYVCLPLWARTLFFTDEDIRSDGDVVLLTTVENIID